MLSTGTRLFTNAIPLPKNCSNCPGPYFNAQGLTLSHQEPLGIGTPHVKQVNGY